VQRNSLRDQVRAVILERIGNGKLPPGGRIVEAALAEEFGVSAIPVREAIRELVAMGVLEFANHKGAWVRQVSLAETVEALEVRAALEAMAGRAAAPRLRGRCAALRREAAATLRAARRRDFAAYQNHNQFFHRLIVEASDNRVLLRTWNTLAFEVRTRPILECLKRGSPAAMAREHSAIVTALEAGDGTRAGALLALHSNQLVEHLHREMVIAAKDPLANAPLKVSKRTRASGGKGR
jgi:DNA-binding GntR family transcriptional regulator